MLILNLQEAFFREREIANKAQANEDIAADIKEEKGIILFKYYILFYFYIIIFSTQILL